MHILAYTFIYVAHLHQVCMTSKSEHNETQCLRVEWGCRNMHLLPPRLIPPALFLLLLLYACSKDIQLLLHARPTLAEG